MASRTVALGVLVGLWGDVVHYVVLQDIQVVAKYTEVVFQCGDALLLFGGVGGGGGVEHGRVGVRVGISHNRLHRFRIRYARGRVCGCYGCGLGICNCSFVACSAVSNSEYCMLSNTLSSLVKSPTTRKRKFTGAFALLV